MLSVLLAAHPATGQEALWSADDRPLVGAIRWDAWQDDGGVRAWTELALSPTPYHRQAPWFARETEEGGIEVPLPGPEMMDREIAYAVEAGIDYWAFCAYPETIGMSRGLRQYLASDRRGEVRFCLNLQGGWLGNKDDWDGPVARYIGYFGLPNYQTVLDGRPLVYCYNVMDEAAVTEQWGSYDAMRAAFDRLRQDSVDAGCGNPYIVGQTVTPEVARRLGFDAVSDYAQWRGATPEGTPFAQMTEFARARWVELAEWGGDIIPLASSGWDERPRSENCPPWVRENPSPRHFVAATGPELAEHVSAALEWVRANPQTARADAILIYSWNEHDEGGWICPTLGADGRPDTSRVDALGELIRRR